MVLKELMASTYHLLHFFNRYDYLSKMNDLEREVISLSTSAQPKYDTLDQTLTGLQTNFLEYEKMYGFPFDGSPLLEVLDIGNYIGVGAIENWRHLVNDEPELFRNVISSSGNKIGAAK